MKKLLPLSLFFFFFGLQPNSAALIRQARTSLVPPIFRACHNVPLSNTFALGKPVVYLSQPSLFSNNRYHQDRHTKSKKMFFLASAVTFTLIDSDKQEQKYSFYKHMPKSTGHLIANIKDNESRDSLSQHTDEKLNSILKHTISDNTPGYGDFMSALGDEFYKRRMYEEAKRAYKNASDEYYSNNGRDKNHRKYIEVIMKIGNMAFWQGKYDEATAYYCIVSYQLSECSNQSDGDAENELALVYEKCGHGFLFLGDYDQAERNYRLAMDLYKKLHGKKIDWIRVIQDFAITSASKGDFVLAEDMSKECFKFMKKENITPTQNMRDNHQMLVELAEKGKAADVQFCLEM